MGTWQCRLAAALPSSAAYAQVPAPTSPPVPANARFANGLMLHTSHCCLCRRLCLQYCRFSLNGAAVAGYTDAAIQANNFLPTSCTGVKPGDTTTSSSTTFQLINWNQYAGGLPEWTAGDYANMFTDKWPIGTGGTYNSKPLYLCSVRPGIQIGVGDYTSGTCYVSDAGTAGGAITAATTNVHYLTTSVRMIVQSI